MDLNCPKDIKYQKDINNCQFEGCLIALLPTAADKKGGGFGAYKLSTQYKGNWNYTFSKPTKQPSFLSAVIGRFLFY